MTKNTKLSPFKICVLENFPFIEADFDAITNYELMCKIVEYLNKVIEQQNITGENVNNLLNWFNNLNVQEEINNKLDEMARDGSLTNLIKGYIDPIITELNEEFDVVKDELSIVQDEVSSVTSGSPAGVYSTISALQQADPDHSRIYVVEQDGEWYYWNNSTSQWKNGGVYQSMLLQDNIVVANKLSNNVKKSLNIKTPEFNVISGKYRNYGTIVTQSGYEYTSPIELKKGETIRFKSQGYSNVISILLLVDDENNYISGLLQSSDNTLKYWEYTANEDCYVSACYVQSQGLNDLIIYKSFESFIENITNYNFGTIKNGYYINQLGSEIVYTNKLFSTTDYIDITGDIKLYVKNIKWIYGSAVVGTAFYNSAKQFISFIQNINADDFEYTTPKNAKYMRMTLLTSTLSQTKLFSYNTLQELENKLNNKIIELDDKIDTNIGLNTDFSSFHKFGVIGDSLASGESVAIRDGQAVYVDNINYSWGQFIARKHGMACINFSSGGLNTRTWLSSQLSRLRNSDNKCNAYIIGLGVNDYSLGSSYIGTSADIHVNDYTLNADTFYGNYGKIISNIKEIQPKAKIFILTCPNQTEPEARDYSALNTAIREIATLFTNVYVIDLASNYNDSYVDGFFKDQLRGGHYNAIGYNYISELMFKWLSTYMHNNYIEFREIEFIGTDYTYYN